MKRQIMNRKATTKHTKDTKTLNDLVIFVAFVPFVVSMTFVALPFVVQKRNSIRPAGMPGHGIDASRMMSAIP